MLKFIYSDQFLVGKKLGLSDDEIRNEIEKARPYKERIEAIIAEANKSFSTMGRVFLLRPRIEGNCLITSILPVPDEHETKLLKPFLDRIAQCLPEEKLMGFP